MFREKKIIGQTMMITKSTKYINCGWNQLRLLRRTNAPHLNKIQLIFSSLRHDFLFCLATIILRLKVKLFKSDTDGHGKCSG